MQGPLFARELFCNSVKQCAQRDGLRFATLTTALRRWARGRGDIRMLVLGHTGIRYTLSLLMCEATVEHAGAVRYELRPMIARFDGRPLDIYIVGPDHADAPMFRRPLAYVVHESKPLTRDITFTG